jgi:hypothetical protein
MWLLLIYNKAIDEADDMLSEASYGEERKQFLNYEFNYDWEVTMAAQHTVAIQKFNMEL